MNVHATTAERATPRPGDDLVAPADVVMDRAFTVQVMPDVVWPWLVQLGKRRAGWYLPRLMEGFLPPPRRALRHIAPTFQQLVVGDVIPDYGGRNETFTVAAIDAPRHLVYRSRRGPTELSWSITLTDIAPGSTRVALRLRMAPVRHPRLARTAGELIDWLTVDGMARGLRERVEAR